VAITLKQRYQKEFNPTTGVIGTQYTKNKYSKDISGGGYSGQPFIKRGAPSLDDELVGQYYDLTTQALSLDFPIRGGSYEEIVSREDFTRIDRFFLYYPQGKAFTDKYRSLLRSNPKIETGRDQGDSNTRVFPIGNQGLGSRNMIEQIASVGTGFHLPNAGSDFNVLTEPRNKYEQIVAKKPKYENRLVSLYELKLLPQPDTEFNPNNNTVIFTGISRLRDTVELINYEGGPGSLYGLGSTLIRRATDNKGAIINTYDAPNFVGPSAIGLRGNTIQSTDLGSIKIDYNKQLGASEIAKINYGIDIDTGVETAGDTVTISNLDQQTSGSIRITNNTDTKFKFASTSRYDQLMKMGDSSKDGSSGGIGKISNFRENINGSVLRSNTTNYNNPSVNKATRVNIGDPGSRTDRTSINVADPTTQDTLNLLDIQDGPYSGFAGNNKEGRDLIKFGFDVIANDGTTQRSINLRAFLTGYSDNHSAQWDSKRYAGRGENFYTYQGFDRTVNFNFKISAQSKQEMFPLYRKLNWLLSTLYPDYEKGTGFMRGNIVRLTLGDLFHRTPGILESLNLTVADEYPWEIAYDSPENKLDSDMLETPQIIDVAASFKPILSSLPSFAPFSQKENNGILLTGDEGSKNAKYLKFREYGNSRSSAFNFSTGNDINASLDLDGFTA